MIKIDYDAIYEVDEKEAKEDIKDDDWSDKITDGIGEEPKMMEVYDEPTD